MAGRSGGGRCSRPGHRHDAAGEPQVEHVGDGGEHGRGRRQRHHQEIDQPVEVGRASPFGARLCSRSMRSSPLRSAARKPSSSVPKLSMRGDHDQRAEDRGPDHQVADRIPFHVVRRAAARSDAPAARDSRATTPAGRCRSGTPRRRTGRTPRRGRPRRTPRRSAPPNGSSPAPRSGSAAARDRTAAPRTASRTRPRRTATPSPRRRQYR